MASKIAIFLLFVSICVSQIESKTVLSNQDRNLIWFPNPKIEGGFIPAFLDSSFLPKRNEAKYESIKFFLQTRNHPNEFELIIDDSESISKSGFISGAKTFILSHGFGGSSDAGFPKTIRNLFLQRDEDLNIISIDWSELATSPWYDVAARSTQVAGLKSAELLTYLISLGLITKDNIHFIGFSLGAHVCGNAGWEFQNLNNGDKLPRCTALDPALPMFSDIEIWGDDKYRVDPSDADFVDVIHTSGGYLFEGGLAFMEPRGHFDFYPNQGKDQPGCSPIDDLFGSCSHGRAPAYLEESLWTEDGFVACKCNDWVEYEAGLCCDGNTEEMGYFVDQSKHDGSIFNKYYLRTASSPPFAIGGPGKIKK